MADNAPQGAAPFRLNFPRGFDTQSQVARIRALDSRFGAPSAAAATGSYRISVTVNGFECHTQSFDTALQTDGAGDEIYILTQVVRAKADGTIVDSFVKRTSLVYGQAAVALPGVTAPIPGRETVPPTNIIGYGTAASPFGGIRSGDRVPNPSTPWKRLGYLGVDEVWPNRLPMLLYQQTGRMDDKSDEVLTVLPLVIEWDGGQQLAGIAQTIADIAAIAVPVVTTAFGGPAWLGALAQAAPKAVTELVKITGQPGDRVIGQSKRADGKFQFDALGLAIRLNPAELQLASSTRNPRGYGAGIYNFFFADDSSLGDSQYSAYVEVRFEFFPDVV